MSKTNAASGASVPDKQLYAWRAGVKEVARRLDPQPSILFLQLIGFELRRQKRGASPSQQKRS